MESSRTLKIPTQTEATYKLWHVTVKAYAAEYDVYKFIMAQEPEPDNKQVKYVHRKKKHRNLLTEDVNQITVTLLGEDAIKKSP